MEKTGRSRHAGFTVVEVVVAIAVVATGVLAVAGTAGLVSRMVGGSRRELATAAAARASFEAMRGASCGVLRSGSERREGLALRWASPPGAGGTRPVSLSVTRSLRDEPTVRVFATTVECVP